MSRLDWLSGYLTRLGDKGAAPRLEPDADAGPAGAAGDAPAGGLGHGRRGRRRSWLALGGGVG
jgi:hypothetical protein